jgi:hypothetical protein
MSGSIRYTRSDFEASTDHLAKITRVTLPIHLKEMEILSIDGVISNGSVAASELHVPELPLTEIAEDPICPQPSW